MNVLDRLTVALATQATAQDLVDLDAEIARLQAVRSLLADALKLSRVTEATPPAAKATKPGNAPRVAAKKPGPKSHPRSGAGLLDERRRRIAAWLAVETMTTAQISQRIELTKSAANDLLSHEWFKKRNHLAPWELTEAGRTALAARTEPTT